MFLFFCCVCGIDEQGKLTDSNLLWSATFVMMNGVAAAGASYCLGWGLGNLTGIYE